MDHTQHVPWTRYSKFDAPIRLNETTALRHASAAASKNAYMLEVEMRYEQGDGTLPRQTRS